MIPSRKTLSLLTSDRAKVTDLRSLCNAFDSRYPLTETQAREFCELASEILNLHGAESIPAGSNQRSPEIVYANTGDSYGTTIMVVNGEIRVGNWGDLVERGSYA